MVEHLIDRIRLPQEVHFLKQVFERSGKSLYAVGGVVRDWLIRRQRLNRGEQVAFIPKDVDLVTEATPEQVQQLLDQAQIRNFPKGEAFGVWVAHMNGCDFEIATFRRDVGSSDGRHPDEVIWATPEEDYLRRDLTINALYYEIPSDRLRLGKILDFGGGIGFEDIEQQRVRVVGDPKDRFTEDKLRVLRLVRFHHRYSQQSLVEVLDARTLDAVYYFQDLRRWGISGPRIQQEFLAGLQQSLSPYAFLQDYSRLDLFPTVFPGCCVDFQALAEIDAELVRNSILTIAVMLRDSGTSSEVRRLLNEIHYPGEITNEVGFLLQARNLMKTNLDGLIEHSAGLHLSGRRQLAKDFGKILVNELNPMMWRHFTSYYHTLLSGEDLSQVYGIPFGPGIGVKQRELQKQRYHASLAAFGLTVEAFELEGERHVS